MTTRQRFTMALATGAAVLLAGLAGCGNGHPGSTRTSAAGNVQDVARPIWGEYVQCARANGFPNWPDPVLDDNGRATFPDVAGLTYDKAAGQIRGACASILARLPAQAQPKENRPVTDEQLAAERRYAQCMREHGVPDWPDPNADGSFSPPQRVIQGGEAVTGTADQSCKSLLFSSSPGSHK